MGCVYAFMCFFFLSSPHPFFFLLSILSFFKLRCGYFLSRKMACEYYELRFAKIIVVVFCCVVTEEKMVCDYETWFVKVYFGVINALCA